MSRGRKGGTGWLKIRRVALGRDDWKCQSPDASAPDGICGKHGRVEVHHVNFTRNDDRLANLTTLCISHHIKIHGKTPRADRYNFAAFVGADFLADESLPAG